jgi:thiol-disulfide isomerase/thioredoxin
MPKRFALILALAACLALALPALALVQTGTVLPALTMPDLNGGEQDITALTKGKVSVLIYWSVSCPLCRKQMPDFMALHKRLAGNPFAMIMINGDGPAMAPAAQAYAGQYSMPNPVLLDSGPSDSMPLAEKLDVIATPTVLVYNPDGVLIHAQELKVDISKLNQAVDNALMQ